MPKFKFSKPVMLGVLVCFVIGATALGSSVRFTKIADFSKKPLENTIQLAQTKTLTKTEKKRDERRKAREARKKERDDRRKQRSKPRFGSFS